MECTMAQTASKMITIKTHHKLPQVNHVNLKANVTHVIRDADHGIQTAIMSTDGKTVLSVIGLNGYRYLPDPDTDPLKEILDSVLDSEGKEHK